MALHPSQAKAIAEAEKAVSEASTALEAAKRERDEVRDRYRDQLPLGEVVEVAGLRLKRREQRGRQYFDLSGFEEKHPLTKAMLRFVKRGRSFEVWDVKPAK
jgi:phytoene/squalene synthetase